MNNIKLKTLRKTLGFLCQGRMAALSRNQISDADELYKIGMGWLDQRGVQGIGIGNRITASEIKPERVLKVYVKRKLSKKKLGSDLIPKTVTLPSTQEKLPIDIEAIGKIYTQNYQTYKRPLFRGLSIGVENGYGGGTLGCFVKKYGQDDIYLLSCAHVFTANNLVKKRIFQPAVKYGGTEGDNIIASTVEITDINYNSLEYINLVDAGIAKLQNGVKLKESQTLKTTNRFSEETRVKILGSSSGRAPGHIKSPRANVIIHYNNGKTPVKFKNQVLCTSFSSPGDSGSLVVNAITNKVLGILIGGGVGVSVFTPINYVLRELGVKLFFPQKNSRNITYERNQHQSSIWEDALKNIVAEGCSRLTHPPGGIDASRFLASEDANRGLALLYKFNTVSNEFDIPTSVLMAIASRESRVGMPNILDANGFGDHGNGFGIMQVDKRSHTLSGMSNPSGIAHIRQAAGIFSSLRNQLLTKFPNWNKSNILKGSMAAYNFGVDDVRTIEGMDRGTTHNDYSSDTSARAQYFQEQNW